MSVVPSVQELKYSNFVAVMQYGGEHQPTYSDLETVLEELKNKTVFYIIGRETAPTTGQRHLQCYFEFTVRQRRSALVKIVPCFWEPAKGSAEQNIKYCSKDGDFSRGGTPRNTDTARASGSDSGGEGNAKRWKAARAVIERGNLVDLDDQIYVCHHAAVMSIRRQFMQTPPDLDWEHGSTPNLWLYGVAGCGKSRDARKKAPGSYLKQCNKWWDGFLEQETVIIDDFDKAHSVLGHHLKIWGDRYPFIAEIKGGAITIRPKMIIITSNWPMEAIWQDDETLKPMKRRFKQINMSPLDGAFVPPTPELVLPEPGPFFCKTCESRHAPGSPCTIRAAQVINLCEDDESEEHQCPGVGCILNLEGDNCM